MSNVAAPPLEFRTSGSPAHFGLEAARLLLLNEVTAMQSSAGCDLRSAAIAVAHLGRLGKLTHEAAAALAAFELERNGGDGCKLARRAASTAAFLRWLTLGVVDRPKPAALRRLLALRGEQSQARQTVLSAIDAMAVEMKTSRHQAIVVLVTQAQAGAIRDEPLLAAMRLGNARPGSRGAPSVRTLHRWLTLPDLTPKDARRSFAPRPWVAEMLAVVRTQPALSVREAHAVLVQRWQPEWGACVSYSAAWRVLRAATPAV